MFKERQYETLYSSSLKFAPDNEGERSENKMGENISLCTVCNQIGGCPQLSLNSKPFRLKINALLSQLKGKPTLLIMLVNVAVLSQYYTLYQNYYLLSPIFVSYPVTVGLCWHCWSGSTTLVAPSWPLGQTGSVEEPQSESLCHQAALWFLQVPFCALSHHNVKQSKYRSISERLMLSDFIHWVITVN